ncbi:MAG: MetQ/NlpA family ABC transporter substrate-binding protein [Deinococcota bacterium]
MRYLIVLLVVLASTSLAQVCPAPTGDPLNVGVLPVLNALPTYIAAQEGLYEQYGVNVNLVEVNSARDRTIAMQAGQLDVGNSDVVAHVLQVASGQDVKIVRHDSFTADFRFFSIVAGAASGITTVDELISALEDDSAQIAISQSTLIEYLATAMLQQAGYEPEADDYTEVAAIPLRLELLAQGQVAAALLPEPLTTLATGLQGGTALLDDSALEFVPVALTVNQNVIDERPGDVCAYLRAYDDAVELINTDPEAYRQNNVRVPDPVRATYAIPQFAEFRVPSEADITEVTDWMLEVGMIDSTPSYDALVDGQFVIDGE